MTIKLELDLQVAKALQGLASVIAKEDQFDQVLLKTVGITRDQAKANAELVKTQQVSHDLVMGFKKHELDLEKKLSTATIEEKNKILKKSVEVEQLIKGFVLSRQSTILESENLIGRTKANWDREEVQRMRAKTFMLKAHQNEQGQFNKVLMTTEEWLSKAGLAQQKVTGMEQLTALAQAAGLYTVVNKAVSALTSGFERLKAEMAATMGRSEGLLQSRQDLFTASGYDVASFRSGQQIARQLAGSGVSEMDATAAVTMGRQFDVLNDQDVLAAAKMQASTGGSLLDKVKLAGAVKTAYPGVFDGARGTEQINEIAIAAANKGSWMAGDVPRVMAGSIIAGKRLGASYEELMAGGAVMSEAFPANPDTAGDRMALIANRFSEDEQFRGLGLMGSIAKLKNMPREKYAAFVGDETDPRLSAGMSDAEYKSEVGKRIEMAQAVNALSAAYEKLGRYKIELEGVGQRSGTPSGLAAEAGTKLNQVPEISGLIQSKASGEKLDQALEQEHLDWAARSKMSKDRVRTALIEAKVPGIVRAGAAAASYFGDLFAGGMKLGIPEGAGALELQLAQGLATPFGASARAKVATAASRTPEGAAIQTIDAMTARKLNVLEQIRDLLGGRSDNARRAAAQIQAAKKPQ